MPIRLERADTPNFSNRVLIYGAGNTGRSIFNNLEKIGVNVIGFIDQDKRGRVEYCGRPLFRIDEVKESLRSEQIIISIHNRAVNIVDVIRLLNQYGMHNILTMVDYVNANPSDSTFRFFLSPAESILADQENISRFHELLGDEKSKALYEAILRFRLGNGYQHCPLPEAEGQYVPFDVPKWKNPTRLIDCGAYDGDSIKLFQKAGLEMEAIVAFEPDLNNYEKLIQNSKEVSITCLPCGVGKTAGVLHFNSGDGEGSRISDMGDSVIQICSIDETLNNWAPTLIKMDIEGAEYDAIQGAKVAINKYRPGMAVSAYHTPHDLWRLGLAIDEIVEGYDYYLRCHAYSSFDTVLYAVPR